MSTPDILYGISIARYDEKSQKAEIITSLYTQTGLNSKQQLDENAAKISAKAMKLSETPIKLTTDGHITSATRSKSSSTGVFFVFLVTFDPDHLPSAQITQMMNELQTEFNNTIPSSRHNDRLGSLAKSVEPVLEKVKSKYNSNSLIKANQQVTQVKQVMTDNVKIAVQNSERIEEMEVKSAEIEKSSEEFHNKSKKVKCHFIKQRIKIIILIIFVILVVIAIILAIALTR